MAALSGTLAGLGLAAHRQRSAEAFDDVAAEIAVPVSAAPPGARPVTESFIQPDPDTLRGVPPYPGASPRKLLSQGIVDAVPTKASWFSTTDSSDDVLGFYKEALSRTGRRPVSHRYSANMGYVAWLDRKMPLLSSDGGSALAEGDVHLISTVSQSGQTTVMLSVSQPQRLLDAVPTLPPGVLLPPRAKVTQVLSGLEHAADARMVFARVPDMAGNEVTAFFQGALSRQGWSVGQGDSPDTLRATRGVVTQTIRVNEASPTEVVIALESNGELAQ